MEVLLLTGMAICYLIGFFCVLIFASKMLCCEPCDDDDDDDDVESNGGSNRGPSDRQIINNVPNNVIIKSLPSALNPKIRKSIPIVDFNSRHFKDGMICVVCLLDLVDGDKSRILPSCNHCFHVDCIDMWLNSHSTCPLCRTKIRSVNQTRSETDRSSCNREVSIEFQIPAAMDDAEFHDAIGDFADSLSFNEV